MLQQFYFWVSGYLFPQNKNVNSKSYMHPWVHYSILYSNQDMEANEVLTIRWMDKEVAYIYNGLLLSHKKNGILPFVTTRMSLEGLRLNEMSQTEEDKSLRISFICGIYKTNK